MLRMWSAIKTGFGEFGAMVFLLLAVGVPAAAAYLLILRPLWRWIRPLFAASLWGLLGTAASVAVLFSTLCVVLFGIHTSWEAHQSVSNVEVPPNIFGSTRPPSTEDLRKGGLL